MKPIAFLLLFLNTEYWTLSTAEAKDFGVHGHTFVIQEPDLLQEMERKLKQLQADGKLADINKTFLKSAENTLTHPKPVTGITKAMEPREFFYDPSILVPYDLKDHEGRVFHKAGTRINPLEFHSLPAPLIFIDGEDKAQVSWTKNTYIKENQRPKIILTSGSPFELMKQWQAELDQSYSSQDNSGRNNFVEAQLVYFDQGGILTSKLGIRHVPAVVVQAGLKLKISEIVVGEKVLKEDKP